MSQSEIEQSSQSVDEHAQLQPDVETSNEPGANSGTSKRSPYDHSPQIPQHLNQSKGNFYQPYAQTSSDPFQELLPRTFYTNNNDTSYFHQPPSYPPQPYNGFSYNSFSAYSSRMQSTPINMLHTGQVSAKNPTSIGSQPYSTRAQRSPTPNIQPVAPTPKEDYIAQAELQTESSQTQQPLLVVLDMNGTLIYRRRRTFPPQFTKRPGLDTFLRYLFDNFKVMIWTSSQPRTVNEILGKLLPPAMEKQLVGVWSRKDLDLTSKQYNERVQVYKRLDKVWGDAHIQSQYPNVAAQNIKPRKKKNRVKLPQILGNDAQVWDQTNTILIDDSKLKAAAQPHNIIEIPEFTNDSQVDEIKNLNTVIRQLDILSRQKDVSRKLREWNQGRPDGDSDSIEVDAFWKKELVHSSLDLNTLESVTFQEKTVTSNTTKTAKDPEVPPSLTIEQLINAAKKSHATNKQQKGNATKKEAAGEEPKRLDDGKPRLTKNQKRAAARRAAKLKKAGSKKPDPVDSTNKRDRDTDSVSSTSISGGVLLPTLSN
ncbi:NIF domain-containing protein [Nannizzia gypsea CBS 118893]|uniref:Mitochondrial import inner membrane translocase subunit TIM50 n=1 Tax=Arthroderma gypseum (strain ATCC MYA-4604 / CBS 118893) TaxID=535722 RepID=E4UZC4_ARTGP|nr:NIF domain-containing protein [Nannizzia gypsea CBS 118893]EFR03454.1 NIF domain-containing protein [Nannizzia gypsea CBS 118893]